MKSWPALVGFCLLVFTVPGCHPYPPRGTSPLADGPIPTVRSADAYYYYCLAQMAHKGGQIDQAEEFLRLAMQADPGSAWLSLELSRLFIEKGNVSQALDLVKKTLLDNPDHLPSLHLLGVLSQQLDLTREATDAFERIIALAPAEESAYLMLGAIYRKASNWSDAKRVYLKMADHFPSSYLTHFFLGQVTARLGQFAESEKHLRYAIFLEPEMEAPRFELIGLYEAGEKAGLQDRSEAIIELYREILENDPQNARAGFELALLYHNKGRGKEAKQLLAPLGRRSRFDPGLIQLFIELYLEPHKYAAAAVLLDYLIVEDPESDALNYFGGVVANELERHAQALSHFERVSPDSEYFPSAAAHLAFIYQQQGRLAEAIQYLDQVLARDANNPELLFYMGSFYEEIEDFASATRYYNQAIERDPDNTHYVFRLGVVYDKQGQKNKAIETMRDLVRRDPDNASALNYLGYTYADLGQNLAEAESLIERALQIKPNDGFITDSLGWVYYQTGRYEQAFETLTAAIALVPDDPVILEHFGDVSVKLNRWADALNAYRQALALTEKNTEVLKEKIQQVLEKMPRPPSP